MYDHSLYEYGEGANPLLAKDVDWKHYLAFILKRKVVTTREGVDALALGYDAGSRSMRTFKKTLTNLVS